MKSPFVYHNLISRIIRCQINAFKFFVGGDCPVPIIPMRVYMWRELFKLGASFYYQGDEIVWDWREKNWISIGCGVVFKTLDDLDSFWERYDSYTCKFDQEDFLFDLK